MKKTLLVAFAMSSIVALPVLASAQQGIVGDCVDCHTMHNSESGMPVALHGTSTTASNEPIQNLLRMDCIACHASPDATGKLMTLSGGSIVPQVSQPTDDNLAGGNFRYSTTSDIKGHNVIDLTPADGHNGSMIEGTEVVLGAPPGNAHASHHGLDAGVFSVTDSFDQFTCAGARGCHGTRSQLLSGATVDNGTANNYEGVRRTGIAAISGAHHNSYDGAKTSDGYVGDGAGHGDATTVHDGQMVADGYRFIPGLKAYGNEAPRWQNVDASSHNEYFATAGNTVGESAGCGTCHLQATTINGNWGLSARAGINSTMPVPGNDMSGFCGTCHGVFHSAGTENGTSGAFLRHPSDWVIPATGEYAAYTSYDITAPVARPAVATAASATVTPGTDMVMCLSCHAAHATENDYMLRFDYSVQTAGAYADIATAQAVGGCQACHTTKGVLPENR
jgi:hypothetical protein